MGNNMSAYGAMFDKNNAVATTINTASEYHALENQGTGLCSGFAFDAGSNGAITDTADNGGVLRCTDVAHGLATGDMITLNGMGDAAHNGITAVTVIGVDTFDCDNIVYNSIEDTGSWQQGSSLTVGTGGAGIYMISWGASGSAAVSAKEYHFECFQNIVAIDGTHKPRTFTGTTIGNFGSPAALVSLAESDIVWCGVENVTDTTNLTIADFNLSLVKL